MSEETTAPTPEKTETETPEPKPAETVDFWKTKSREWEIKAKENFSAAQKLAEFEERNKTEQEKVLDQARKEASEAATAPLQLQVARLEVALEKGLTLTQVKRLVGSSKDELLADADLMLEESGGRKDPPPPFNGGPRTTSTAADFNSMLRRAAGRG